MSWFWIFMLVQLLVVWPLIIDNDPPCYHRR